MQKIECIREIVVFENEYGKLYNDEVIGPTGSRGNYLRWKWNGEGVIVVPVLEGKFALARMYRYSPGVYSIEFPGGGIENNETIEDAAARELLEEFGLLADKILLLGRINPDTGILAGSINVALAYVKAQPEHKLDAVPEVMEAIDGEIIWKTFSEFKRDVALGHITAGTTISSAMLYLSWLEQHE